MKSRTSSSSSTINTQGIRCCGRYIESTAGSRTHPRARDCRSFGCARSVSALTPAGLHSTFEGPADRVERGVGSLHPNHPNTADVPACPRRAQEDSSQCAPPIARRAHGPVRRLGHAGRILRASPTSTWPSGPAPVCSTSATWGRSRSPGADALAAVQHITSNDAAKLAVHQIQYSALTTPQGTFVDDVLTYKLADEHFMLVVNASNIMKDFNWITEQIAGLGDAVAVNTSSRYALLALQGPAARDVLQTLTGVNLSELKYYWFTTGEVASVRCTISRTGYTGEDGFEVFVPPASAERVWDAILSRGAGRRRGSGRARRARHAPARSGDAPLRQRHGRDHDRRRGGSRVDCRLEEDRVPRLRRAEAAEGRGRAAQACRVRDARPRHRAAWLRRLCRRRQRRVSSRAAPRPRF